MRFPALLLLSGFVCSANAESWICVPDHAFGLNYDSQSREWEEKNFSTDRKYVVRRSKLDSAKWEFVEVGSEEASTWSAEDFNSSGYLQFSGLQKAEFSRSTLRFTLVQSWPWVLSKSGREKDSVFLVVGRCTAG
jgi:hypothetical protein